MANELELITVTKQNYHFAVLENWRRIYRALQYKIPLTGTVVLEGDIDFDDTYTVFGCEPEDLHTAYTTSDA